MTEIFKIIEECPDYKISNFGNVVNNDGEIRPLGVHGGVYSTSFRIEGKSKGFRIGQLVAKYFLDPLHDNFHVGYKDNNKLNNNINNLELNYYEKHIKIINDIQLEPIDKVIKKFKLIGRWKYVKNACDYLISDMGEIIYTNNGKKLNVFYNTSNYHQVTIKHQGMKYIHILIAESFLNIDETKTYNIVHKDGNKNNNILSNIEIKYHGQVKEKITLEDISLENEIWKSISNYENLFMVSDQGRIINLDKMKVKELQPHKNNGYVRTTLCNNNIKIQFSVHILVAEAFLENIDNKPQVNHINGIKHDNRLENLEWATCSENITHAIKTGLLKINGTKTFADQAPIKNEIWKICPLNNAYKISTYGRVKNNNNNKILKGSITEGYLHVHLYGDDTKTYSIHRLVALTFLPEVKNKNQVNHKNGIKTDNKLENLEWANSSENTIHAFETGLFKPKTCKVSQFDLSNNFIRNWNSMTEASNDLNIPIASICRVCRGTRKTGNGFIWKYNNE
jgi:hypothetical protein